MPRSSSFNNARTDSSRTGTAISPLEMRCSSRRSPISTPYKNPEATADSLLSDDREFDNRTSLVVDPPDGRIPPLTAAARQKQAGMAEARAAVRQRGRMEPGDLSNALRCITWGVPRLIVTPFTDHYQVIQSPGYVVLDLETDRRIIPTDGRPHLAPNIRPLLGDSRGRWDGHTLVIDTTNFSPKAISWAPRNTCILSNA